MFLPAELLPVLAALFVALVLDVVILGGKYTHQLISMISGNTYQKIKVRSGTKFCGVPFSEMEVVGYVERGGRRVPRLAFITSPHQRQVHDSDDLDIPFTALKAGMMAEDVDVTLRFEKAKKYQDEIDGLRYRLATANTKANMAWGNSMDFTVQLTSSMGDIKKNIGSTIMMASKGKDGGFNIAGADKEQAAEVTEQ
jgi:hypothetical protein